MKKYTLMLFVPFLLITNLFAVSNIIRVKPTGNDANDGSSWLLAKQTIQAAINSAASGDQVWVAAGTYTPTTGTDRTISFQMKSGVEIYGGFAGTESSTMERTNYGLGQVNKTILSGEIQTDADSTNNSYHIIYNNGVNSAAMLDGFIITSGYADGAGASNYNIGGGIFNNNSSPIIHDCIFIYNYSTSGGGGICNNGSSPYITNCKFIFNHDNYSGGAICSQMSSSPQIETCHFLNNSAQYHAGAVLNYYSHSTITNSEFMYNSCGTNGGAIENYGNASGGLYPTITNCIFSGNTAVYGGAIENTMSSTPLIINCSFNRNSVENSGEGGAIASHSSSNPTVKNSIFWGNLKGPLGSPTCSEINGGDQSLFTYCCIEGENSTSFSGIGNIFVDPLFTNPSLPDLSLQDASPCIGAGIAVADVPTSDISFTPRGTPPDMGAIENSRDIPLPVELTSFIANKVDNSIELKWQTATEVNNYGFEIERSLPQPLPKEGAIKTPLPLGKRLGDGPWEMIGFVSGAGNSNSPKEYSYVDSNPVQGNAEYRLKQIDLDGNFKYYSNTAKINFLTAVKEKQIPKEFALLQNYPNPFNPFTNIEFTIADFPEGTSRFVSLKVYDVLGNEVATLVNENKQAGYYSVSFNASNLSTGVYIYRLTAGKFILTKKLMLMK